MPIHRKPVRRCHSCRLNLHDHCWLFDCPRDQWRKGRECAAFDNPGAIERFMDWSKHQPRVKTGKDLRRGLFRPHPRYPVPDLSSAEKAEILAALRVRTDTPSAGKTET